MDPKLPPAVREVLDEVDVIEQKADLGLSIGIKAFYLALLCLAFAVIFNGAAILALVQEWLKKGP